MPEKSSSLQRLASGFRWIMLPSFLKNEGLRLIFFGGKGGVGKTTSASAAGLWLAEKYPERKFLLISADPAHSLSDSFEMKIGDELLQLYENLFLREFSAAGALEKFKKKYEHQIKLITDRGTYFDNADIDSFFSLSLPGIDEVMGILEIAGLVEKHDYDTVIVDTAPTGHTLSMLRLPELLDKWLSVFDLMEGKHHLIQEHFAHRTTEDEADAFLQMMHGRLQKIGRLLRSSIETEFVVVTMPEEMVFAETERLLVALFELQMPVHSIIVNRVLKNAECPNCEKRGSTQQPLLSKIEAKSSYRKISIPVFPAEVRGRGQLELFAKQMVGCNPSLPLFERKAASKFYGKKLSISSISNMKLIMICGKGGVGKTTTAAATALVLAGHQSALRHKLYSIDPAHSLSDCFSKTIGDEGTRIFSNLDAYELNAERLYQNFQSEYQDAIDELFEQFTGSSSQSRGVDFGYDRELLKELLSTSPPGLEELMALHKIISELESGTDCVILDTAPTGHFVRFLELPSLVRMWLTTVFELLLKYRGVVRLGTVAEKLISLSRKIRSVMEVISDNRKTCVLVIMIPEAMSFAETERLIKAVNRHKIKCAGLIVNMAADGSGDCSFCAARSVHERQWIENAGELCRNAALAPFMLQDIRGVERLAEFGRIVWQ